MCKLCSEILLSCSVNFNKEMTSKSDKTSKSTLDYIYCGHIHGFKI